MFLELPQLTTPFAGPFKVPWSTYRVDVNERINSAIKTPRGNVHFYDILHAALERRHRGNWAECVAADGSVCRYVRCAGGSDYVANTSFTVADLSRRSVFIKHKSGRTVFDLGAIAEEDLPLVDLAAIQTADKTIAMTVTDADGGRTPKRQRHGTATLAATPAKPATATAATPGTPAKPAKRTRSWKPQRCSKCGAVGHKSRTCGRANTSQ